jgi:sugar lactone lactonase YvrE
MRDIDRRSASGRRSRPIATLAIAVLVAACSGTGGSGASITVATGEPAAAPAAPSAPTETTAPTASPVTFIRPEASIPAAPAVESPLDQIWSASGPALGRGWTWTPTVDPQGRIWAASSFDDVFWIVDRDGTYLESWGKSGKGDGQFRFRFDGNGFGAIAFRPDGGFYVADSGNSRVQQFDAARRFVRTFGGFGTDPGQFILPLDIDLDAAGKIYVYDGERGVVQVFSPDGAYLRTAATHVGPYVAVDPEGNVYAVDNDPVALYRYTPAGGVDLAVDLRSVLHFATGIALAPDGDLFIGSSDNGGGAPTYESLLQLDAGGTLKHLWPNGAEAIALDPAGDRLYATGSDVFTEIRAFRIPED